MDYEIVYSRFGFKPITEDDSEDDEDEKTDKTAPTTTEIRGKDKKAMNRIVQKKVAKTKAFKKTVQLSGAKKSR